MAESFLFRPFPRVCMCVSVILCTVHFRASFCPCSRPVRLMPLAHIGDIIFWFIQRLRAVLSVSSTAALEFTSFRLREDVQNSVLHGVRAGASDGRTGETAAAKSAAATAEGWGKYVLTVAASRAEPGQELSTRK